MRTLARSATVADPRHPPGDGLGALFHRVRGYVSDHPRAFDALLAGGLLAASTVWLARLPNAGIGWYVLQVALIAPLVWRRAHPSLVFAVITAFAFAQWLLSYRLIADGALLVALYTVAAHQSRVRALTAAAVLEVGVIIESVSGILTDTWIKSLVFLSGLAMAALLLGITVRIWNDYLSWLVERAERLELERDQQARLAAAAERARIAREMHDVVAHSIAVMVTLADGAAAIALTNPVSTSETLGEVSATGRQALTDMRRMLGVLRAGETDGALAPQPGIGDLPALIGRVGSTGLDVELRVEGSTFPFPPTAELTVYRIVQEALTNIMKHATAGGARITLRYDRPMVHVSITDDGRSTDRDGNGNGKRGHGIAGMQERAGVFGGTLRAGPGVDGGWEVSTTLQVEPAPVRP
ncbi:MAG TPA: histidine kinase [Acidimicrobiales bacterium]|nr:histidine kinase [Acidimicrobiales bacterium]